MLSGKGVHDVTVSLVQCRSAVPPGAADLCHQRMQPTGWRLERAGARALRESPARCVPTRCPICAEVKLDVDEGDWCWVYQQQIRLGDRIVHHCWDVNVHHSLVRGLYDTCQEGVAIYNFERGVFHGCAELRGSYATKAECISAAERDGATDIELSS